MKRNSNRGAGWVLAGLITVFAGSLPLSAATATFTIVDEYDDAFAYAADGENYTNEYVICGQYTGYSAPFITGVFRFANVSIPQGTVISSAYLRVQAYLNGTGNSKFTIQGEDYDSSDVLYDGEWLADRTLTTASATWTVSSAWVMDGVYTSPDLKTIVQEIVDRPGWSSGNALSIHLRNALSSGGYQIPFSKEGVAAQAAYGSYSSAELIVTYAGGTADGVKSEAYLPGATNSPSLFPLYLNDPDMYYPAASGGLCWASANADIFAYWERTAYNGVTYWNLIDNGLAPLRQPALPTGPGHGEADVKSVVAWLASQYYGLGRADEDGMLEEFANATNGLAFNATYHGPVSTTAERTTFLNTIKGEINAGRPISIGSWGTYFGGAHQIPVLGYKEMSNTVNSTVYIHRNTGGTQSEYVNFFASSWGNLDMDQIVPGGTPVDHYEAAGDNTTNTAVTIAPDDVYNFRQTHNFSAAGDVDWIRLGTVAGRRYTIATTNLGAACDTVLAVYQTNGVTQLLQDDDGGTQPRASKIVWRCWSTGTHLLRLSDKAGGSGAAANYDVQVSYAAITNEAPTDLTLSPAAVAENQPAGAVAGTLASVDPDFGNTFTYTLVPGSGSADNGAFTISNAQLKTAAVFNYEAKNSYAVRIRATDQNGLFVEKALSVAVVDVAEATSAGTPYAWLDQYGLVSGGNYEAADAADVDGDGLTAGEEYVSGTVPTNGASVFYAVLQPSNGTVRVHWSPDLTGAVPARVYSVYGTSSLLDGFPPLPFTNLPAGMPVVLPALSSNGFFKVGVGIQ